LCPLIEQKRDRARIGRPRVTFCPVRIADAASDREAQDAPLTTYRERGQDRVTLAVADNNGRQTVIAKTLRVR
jgi:hypothetical protein